MKRTRDSLSPSGGSPERLGLARSNQGPLPSPSGSAGGAQSLRPAPIGFARVRTGPQTTAKNLRDWFALWVCDGQGVPVRVDVLWQNGRVRR